MNLPPKIAIATINKNQYSETFIKSQIDYLPASLVLYGDWFPTHYGDDRLIFSKIKNQISRIIRLITKKKIFTKEKELVKVLKRHNIQVVLAQYGLSGAELIQVCKICKIPLIVHFHGFDASKLDILSNYKTGYREMFRDAYKIIAVSSSMQTKLISLGCDANKIELVHYGPRNEFFLNEPNYKSKTFFSIGRFVDKKAPYLTILSFNLLLQEYQDAKLIMAGDGELLGVCKSIVKAFKIEDKVFFTGILNLDQTIEYMQSSLAYIQHSITAESGDSEGTPLAILEAQAARLPVISTYHAGIPDVVIDKTSGFLVEENDICGMKDAMLNILNDRELASRLGQKGRETVKENFTMEIYINKLASIIRDSLT
jgi:colanic acid/amylovoran biosynthesis glycosyltransferase